jgi:ferritin-like metal-binding protein YciE
MGKDTIDEQLDAYLADAHAIEEQALVQMKSAPDIAGEERLAEAFRAHLAETEDQLRLVTERLEARGGSPSRLKEIVMKVGGKGFVFFARSQPDTPGKLTAHAYSYEALEQASYELLERVSLRAGDEATAAVARAVRDQEHAMLERLAGLFDAAAAQSLVDQSPDDVRELVASYLADAHALEEQSIQLLELGSKSAGDAQLERVLGGHLEESRAQQRRLQERLDALGDGPSRIKNAAMRAGALNWGAFFQGHPDTPGKLAAFAFAYEHLEIAGYELLERTAAHVGDDATAALAIEVREQERAAARRIAATFDHVVETTLQEQGVRA